MSTLSITYPTLTQGNLTSGSGVRMFGPSSVNTNFDDIVEYVNSAIDQEILTTSSPTFTGLTISGLTASSLIATDATNVLTSDTTTLTPVFAGLGIGGTPVTDFHVLTNDNSTQPQVFITNAGTGDASCYFTSGAVNMTIGIDRTDNLIKIQSVAALAGNTGFNMNTSGHIGINQTPSATDLVDMRITATNTNAVDTLFANLIQTVSSGGAYNNVALNFQAYTNITNGISNTGYLMGVIGSAYHNSTGNLSRLDGINITYGTSGSAGGIVSVACGMCLRQLNNAAELSKSYDIYIDTPQGGLGSTPDDWCIYSLHNAKSYLYGDLLVGSTNNRSALDVTERTYGAGLCEVLWLSGGLNSRGSGPSIVFNDYYANGSYPTWQLAEIGAVYSPAGSWSGDILFLTNDGSAAATVREVWRINYQGHLRAALDNTYIELGASADWGLGFNGTNGIIDLNRGSNVDLNIISGDVKIGGSAGDNPAEHVHSYLASGNNYLLIETGDANAAGIKCKNSVTEWFAYNNSTGKFCFYNSTAAQVTAALDSNRNFVIGGTDAGADASYCLVLMNDATTPSGTANKAHIWTEDLSTSTVLAFMTETNPIAETDETKFSHKIPIRYNGSTYYVMCTVS